MGALGFSLVFSLFLLFPGFISWVALFLRGRRDIVSAVPEKPGSVLVLSVIVFGSVTGQLIWSAILATWRGLCGQSGRCSGYELGPGLFDLMGYLSRPASGPSHFDALPWFGMLFAVSALTAALVVKLSTLEPVRTGIESLQFRWLLQRFKKAQEENSFVIAHVVTNLQSDGQHVGYRGAVDHIVLNEDGTISLIVLVFCDRFIVLISDGAVSRLAQPGGRIGFLSLPGTSIANIAFEVMEQKLKPEPMRAGGKPWYSVERR